MVTTQHHPTDEYLLLHAAGALPEGQALVVASHLTFCAACREVVGQAEAIGGALLAGSAETSSGDLDLSHFPFDLPPARTWAPIQADVPGPLRPYIGNRMSGIRWRCFWPGMQIRRIRCEGDPSSILLLRFRAGKGIPVHTHEGDELTLVLQGSYTDATGQYRAGDVAFGDDALTHQPIADAGDHCVCLVVSDTPTRFSGRLARLAGWALDLG